MVRHNPIVSVSAFIVALLLLAYLIWDVATPHPVSIEESVGTATIVFRSDSDAVLLAGGCVNISWQVDQIQAVYLNGDGKGGNGQEVYCSQVEHPTLTVDFRDDTTRDYTLPIRTLTSDARIWLGLLGVAALIIIAFSTSTVPVIRRWSDRFWLRLYTHLNAVKVTPGQLRLAQIMGYIFSVLNLMLVITLLRLGNFSPLLLIHLGLAVAGTIVGVFPRTHRFLAQVIQLRWFILLPIVWFIVNTSILLDVQLDLVPRSAVRAWDVTLFFWLIVFWLISYTMRSFIFDKQRRFAWLSVAVLFGIVTLLSLTVPLLAYEQNPLVERHIHPSTLLYYYAHFNTDSIDYVRSAQNFPSNWRYMSVIHRPTYTMMAAQMCLLLDIPLHGYAAPYGGCSNDTTVILAMWLIHFSMGLICLLIVYELVSVFLDNTYVAWLAALFAALSPFHLWTLAVPSTDYVEIFILHLALWLMYRLFIQPNYSITRILTFGLVLGTMLLIKLNVIPFMIALALVLVLRRWWLLLVWTVLPFGLTFLYTQFIPRWGVPYTNLETAGRWSTIRWLWLEYIYFTPQRMWRTLGEWGGYITYQVIVAFGLFFVAAVFALSFDRKASRTVVPLGWLMFFASAAFAFIGRASYTAHILQLMPVIYGGAALGIWQIQTSLEQHYPNRLWIARTAGLLLITVAVLHLLLQWFVFGTHGSRAIIVLLSTQPIQ